MAVTGARWSLTGAEAVLRLRALCSSRDFDEYWTFSNKEDNKQLSLITQVSVESADESDARALLPATEDSQQKGLGPQEVLAHTAYGSDDNCKQAKELGVEIISPAKGPDTEKDISVTFLRKQANVWTSIKPYSEENVKNLLLFVIQIYYYLNGASF